ncbi:LOB domain-containing protein 41 [Raphanus sativus]|uniref:LOB domain-containing protein 41 n=1 Tax=Raphanus sativus TaxID=3726 RepID=A0A6J0JC77_RAPSA|nr:LOB domain-containing protein 41 [Raphanus sativus]KAJ4886309.1 LOB domain-containing protein 41 [Raphanus sativus]
MRMSCNGCRVLRKGCSEDCSIRPCLGWIKSPEAQANATVFLAKFYGRAGLMNLINAGPEHLRPGIFRSLLHEACGRIVNPIYGSVGLLWSGNWQLCQSAVEAVMRGEPITEMATDAATSGQGPPLKMYDIRHISKDENSPAAAAAGSTDPKRGKKARRAKRVASAAAVAKPAESEGKSAGGEGEASHDSSLSHQSEVVAPHEEESNISKVMTFSPTAVQCSGEIKLDLTLGLEPASRADHVVPVKKRKMGVFSTWQEESSCKTDLVL